MQKYIKFQTHATQVTPVVLVPANLANKPFLQWSRKQFNQVFDYNYSLLSTQQLATLQHQFDAFNANCDFMPLEDTLDLFTQILAYSIQQRNIVA